MVTAIVVIFFALVMLLDFRVTVQSKKKTEIWIYAVCLSLSFAVMLLRSLNVPLPDPSEIIVDAARALSFIHW